MRQIPAMTFRGALRILGHHDNTVLEKLDALLGGAILGVGVLALAGPTAAPLVGLAAIWGWVDQKNEATRLLRKLLIHVSNRKLGLVGYERSQLVAAAHAALATSAVMDAFRDLIGEKTFKKLKITPAEQEALLSGSSGQLGQNLVDILYDIEVPMPSAGRGFEENIIAVQQWQEKLASTLLIFCSGLEAWNGVQADPKRLLRMSIDRYVHSYYLLAAEVPEFMVWAAHTEHAAARAAVRGMHEDMRAAMSDQANAMSRLESLLTIIAGGASGFHHDVVDIVHQTNLAALDEPIIPRESSKLAFLSDIRFPLVRNIYVQPRYRCDSAPIRNLDTLAYWARTLRIPAELLWFTLPDDKHQRATTEPAAEPPSPGVQPAPDTSGEHPGDPERDPVLIAPWNHRGTVEVAVGLNGGDGRVKRRVFLFLTGPALTAPAHQWLVHEPGPLVSGLAGRRVSAGVVDRLSAMITELRKMDDVAGGGSVLAMASKSSRGSLGCWTERHTTNAPARGCMWCSPSWDSCVAGRPTMPDSTGWRSATSSRACAPPIPPMTGHWAPTSSRP